LREVHRQATPAAANFEYLRMRRDQLLGGEVAFLGELGIVERWSGLSK
jgi:hypothetical protein